MKTVTIKSLIPILWDMEDVIPFVGDGALISMSKPTPYTAVLEFAEDVTGEQSDGLVGALRAHIIANLVTVTIQT